MTVSSEIAAYALEVAKVREGEALRGRFIAEFGAYVANIRATAAEPPLIGPPPVPVEPIRKRLGRLKKALATVEAELADEGEIFSFFIGNGLARSLKSGDSERASETIAKFWPEQKTAFRTEVSDWREAVEFLASEVRGRPGAPPDPRMRSDLKGMVAGAAWNLVSAYSVDAPTT